MKLIIKCIKQKVLLIIGYLLSKYRYSKINDPFLIFNNMKKKKNGGTKKNNQKNIIIFPVRVSPSSNLFEGLIGKALTMKGFNVFAFMDGGELDISENDTFNYPKLISKSLSYYEQLRFEETFDVENLYIQNYINNNAINDLIKKYKNFTIDELCNLSIDDIAVGKHAKFGLMRYLRIETLKSKHRKLLLLFLKTAIKVKFSTENLIKNKKIEFAILSHGCYSTWGTIADVLGKNKIKYIVWGRGYVGNGNIILAKNDSYLYEYIYEDIAVWKNRKLDDKTIKKVLSYYEQKRLPNNNVDGISYYKEKSDRKKIKDLKNISKKYKSIIGVFPNIPWDGTMFSGTESFPTLRKFVLTLLEYIIMNNDVLFVIRPHPAEFQNKGNITDERFIDILNECCEFFPNNMYVIKKDENISSYDVADIADAAVMFGSTLSLELTISKCPVIQVGRTNTTNKGFIFDSPTKSILFDNLNKAVSKELIVSESMHSDAINYAYHWIYNRHIPEEIVNLSGTCFESYNIESEEDLINGYSKSFEFILNTMQNNNEFIYK